MFFFYQFIKTKIAELKSQHLEDLKAQTIAQKAALSSLKATLENSKLIEIELLNEENRKKFGKFLFFEAPIV